MLKVQAGNFGNVAVLRLQGRIINGETADLRNALYAMPKALTPCSAVILDLARVTTVDASGLGLMLELREQAESKGFRFELMNVTKLVSRILALTRLDSVFRISAGVEFSPPVSRSPRPSMGALASCA
jgi:anti-anti-sigma factor